MSGAAEITIGREEVKAYLRQYSSAKRKKKILEDRRRTLSDELKAPRTGQRISEVSATRTVKRDSSVSVIFRIEEVEERIDRQREEMAKTVLNVMDLIDLLPSDSTERTIVELRHIDCLSWNRIADTLYMSRSSVFDYYNAALDELLKYKRTKKLIEDFGLESRGRT